MTIPLYYITTRYKMKFSSITLINLLIIILSSSISIPTLNEEIGQAIFQDRKIYMIYVVQDEQKHNQTLQMFEQFCQQTKHLCVLLNRKVQNYDAVRMFIGEKKQEYFCLINAAQRKKYVLPIIEGMTTMDLLIFQSKFEQGTLEQFLASEEPQIQPYKPCRKLVSRDLSQFLDSQTPVKVIYLYTAHQTCEICAEMLNLFAELAQNMYDEKVVGFGYYDIFANDHPKITDQIVPYFLIFQNSEEQPTGVPAQNMEDLYDMIIQVVMKDVPIPEKPSPKRQKQNAKKFNEREHEVQLEDINLDQLSDIEAEDLDYNKILDDNLQDL